MTKSIDEVLAGGITGAALKERYKELCDFRDRVNAVCAPVQQALDVANTQVARAQAEAHELAARIQEIRGGEKWLDLKRQIGELARAISPKR